VLGYLTVNKTVQPSITPNLLKELCKDKLWAIDTNQYVTWCQFIILGGDWPNRHRKHKQSNPTNRFKPCCSLIDHFVLSFFYTLYTFWRTMSYRLYTFWFEWM
jgi:hypothetical protein